MKDITTLIDRYGADIVKQLNIASSELYSKILWYVRIDGLVELLSWILGLLMVVTGTVFVWRQTSKDDYLKDEIAMRCLVASMGGVIFMLLGMIISQGIMSIVKIVAPEYWIINSIINK